MPSEFGPSVLRPLTVVAVPTVVPSIEKSLAVQGGSPAPSVCDTRCHFEGKGGEALVALCGVEDREGHGVDHGIGIAYCRWQHSPASCCTDSYGQRRAVADRDRTGARAIRGEVSPGTTGPGQHQARDGYRYQYSLVTEEPHDYFSLIDWSTCLSYISTNFPKVVDLVLA